MADEYTLTLGLCAVSRKLKSRHIQRIIAILENDHRIVTIGLDEFTVNEMPPEEWPVVNVLLVLYSNKLSYERILEYSQIRQPLLLNDANKQGFLKNRSSILSFLEENHFPILPYYISDVDHEI